MDYQIDDLTIDVGQRRVSRGDDVLDIGGLTFDLLLAIVEASPNIVSSDELVEKVKLPKHLAESPYLQEFYGKVEWGVRTIFDGNLGWYNGNPSRLSPLGPKALAKRYIKLAGGEEAIIKEVKK